MDINLYSSVQYILLRKCWRWEIVFFVFHLCDVFSTYFFAAPFFFLIFDKIIQFYILNYVCNIGILNSPKTLILWFCSLLPSCRSVFFLWIHLVVSADSNSNPEEATAENMRTTTNADSYHIFLCSDYLTNSLLKVSET